MSVPLSQLDAGTIYGPSQGSIMVIDWSTNPCVQNKPTHHHNCNHIGLESWKKI
jgi:hypothetical protein